MGAAANSNTRPIGGHVSRPGITAPSTQGPRAARSWGETGRHPCVNSGSCLLLLVPEIVPAPCAPRRRLCSLSHTHRRRGRDRSFHRFHRVHRAARRLGYHGIEAVPCRDNEIARSVANRDLLRLPYVCFATNTTQLAARQPRCLRTYAPTGKSICFATAQPKCSPIIAR